MTKKKKSIDNPFEEVLNHWDGEPRQPVVDYKEFANELQNELAKAFVDIQEREKDIEYFVKQIEVLEAHIAIKQKHIDDLELKIAHIDAKENSMYESNDETINEYLSKQRRS